MWIPGREREMGYQPGVLDGPEAFVPTVSPICGLCHYLRVEEGRTCAAFPAFNSIPLDIWEGRNDHTTPVPGDHGIQFAPVTAADIEATARRIEDAKRRIADHAARFRESQHAGTGA